jgi:hypothetical protein
MTEHRRKRIIGTETVWLQGRLLGPSLLWLQGRILGLHSLHVFWALHSFVFFFSTFLCSLGIRVGATKNLEGGVDESSIFLVLFKDSFKDPRYCSLVFFRGKFSRGETLEGIGQCGDNTGTIRCKPGCL